MSADVQEEEHCYQVALPATDAPMTVGRLTDILLRERAAIRAELSHELEVERMRLAACGVAAHGGGDVQFENMKIEYNSDALQATRRLRDERDALKARRDAQLVLHEQGRAENERLRAELAEARRANELYCEDQQAKHDQLTKLRVAAEAALKPWEASDGLDPRWPDTRVQLAHAMGLLRGVLAKDFVDLDARQAHLLALADNRLGELAEWDTPELHAQLAEYSSDEALLAGWDDADLVALATEDPAPVKPAKKVKTEDNHCPYCGRYMSDKLMAAHAKREGQSSR